MPENQSRNYKTVKIDLNLFDKIIHPQKIELIGASNVGTTALSLYLTKKFDEAGMTSLFIDISRRFEKKYLENNKYDKYLTLVSASEIETIYNIFEKFKSSIDLFIIDDLNTISSGTVNKCKHKELLRSMIDYINREIHDNSVIFINQIKIDPISERTYAPYGYLIDADMRIKLVNLEKRSNYRIIQGIFLKNELGKEDYFSFKLYQDKLEGEIQK